MGLETCTPLVFIFNESAVQPIKPLVAIIGIASESRMTKMESQIEQELPPAFITVHRLYFPGVLTSKVSPFLVDPSGRVHFFILTPGKLNEGMDFNTILVCSQPIIPLPSIFALGANTFSVKFTRLSHPR